MDYWLKQANDKPLFADLAYDKPERKDQAGKLLIIGGNLHGFATPAKAYEYVKQEGVGHVRVCLPDALRSTLHAFWTDAVFCPSTPSGSFARDSKELLLNNSLWSDGLLFPGDMGRNSETAIVLDELIGTLHIPITITKDALDYYLSRPKIILDRPNTLIVASFSQLQKLCSSYGVALPLTYTMSLTNLVEIIHELTEKLSCSFVTKFNDKYVVAVGGMVSTTDCDKKEDIWRLKVASKCMVAWLHYPTKLFEGLTNTILDSNS